MPAADIDTYLAGLAPQQAEAVAEVRALVHRTVPDAAETISYDIPTFTLRGKAFFHVAAWSAHLSTYPVPSTDDAALSARLDPHRAGKGTLKFRYADDLPLDLLEQVIELLAEQRTPPPGAAG